MVTDPIKFVYTVGDGITTDFSYAYNGTVGFDADVAEDVRAAILNPDGTRDTNPNFAVLKDTYGNFTGAIRFATAPMANAVVYIYRATPQTQETEYKTSSGFDAKNVENDFDKLTKLVQETSSHARNKTVQLDMFQENVLKFILASEANQNQMLFFDFNTLTFRFTSFTKGQAVISSASASDDKTDIMLSHFTDEGTGLPYLAFSLDQGATWKPMNFAEISAIVNSANAKATNALANSEQAVATANEAKNTADGIDGKATSALANSEQAIATANEAKNTADNAAVAVAGKQDTIPDLATIRAGAAKGATAVQPAEISDMETKAHAAATYQPKGDYATSTELATGLATKADTTTTDTLRNDVDGLGDQVQEIETKIPGNATADNQLATKADLAEKQDKLVSGTNIKTVNGEPLLGSGNVKIDAGGAMPVGAIFTTLRTGTIDGAVECDGATYNTTDFTGAQSIGQLLADGKVPYVSMAAYATEISTKGWCDKFGWDGTGNVQFKVPTLSAYIWQKLQLGIKGSIGTGSGGTYFVATQSNFSQFTHPESGAYGVSVSNDQTIPGASVSVTDEDVSQQRCMIQIATGATDEALETCTSVLSDVSALNAHRVIEFQAPTAANGYTWYRKYTDGWVEQGGYVATTSTSTTGLAVTLPVAMADANYNVQKTIRKASSASSGFNFVWLADSESAYTNTTTTVYLSVLSISNALGVSWQVSGMSAQ